MMKFGIGLAIAIFLTAIVVGTTREGTASFAPANAAKSQSDKIQVSPDRV